MKWLTQLSMTTAALALTFSGCAEKTNAPSAAAAPGAKGANTTTTALAAQAIPGWPPTRAQPKLRTMKLYVGPEIITAELALSEVEIGTGMMFRTTMAEDEGMLFVFARPHKTAFYMKNTTVPLTAAYIDSDGAILELVDLHPLVEAPVEAKSDKVQYVLEMKQGWFKRHKIGVGMVLSTEVGTLRQAFQRGN